MKCESGCDLTDEVLCRQCDSPIFWVDSDEKYAICKYCPGNGLSKLSGELYCRGCGAKAYSKVKWISGYKP